MSLFPPVLDHVVIDVRDRMDEAARGASTRSAYADPARTSHARLDEPSDDVRDRLPRTARVGEGGASRPELAPFPVGLNGLVFKTADADAVHAHAAGGRAADPAGASPSRGRSSSTARAQDARFRTTRLDPGKIAMGRVYFCEHLTPELVWRPEWQAHPNGARAIARVVVATGEPRRTASLFSTLFGPDSVAEADGKCVIGAGSARVELAPSGRHRRRIRRRRRRPGRPSPNISRRSR